MPKEIDFETPRLEAEPLGRRHERLLVRWWSDPGFTESLGGPRPEGVVRARIGVALAHWEAVGFGSWIFRDRETREAVGWVGLRQTAIGEGPKGTLRSEAPLGDPAVEIYYALTPERRRQGLGTEAAGAVVRYAQGLDLPRLVAFILSQNRPSRALAEKLGFRHVGEIEHAGRTHLLYRLALRDAPRAHAGVGIDTEAGRS